MQPVPNATQNSGILPRAWYSAYFAEFFQAKPLEIVGQLVTSSGSSLLPTHIEAWQTQIELLKTHLSGLTGSLFLEFNIPRMGRRIDTVLLIDPVVFVIEFKVGESVFERAALDQVWDYALDLKNFHEASHVLSIVPILVATTATSSPPLALQPDEDKVYRPLSVDPGRFRQTIELAMRSVIGAPLDERQWPIASYRPTPTIIEAARSLYAQHSVEAIAHFDAGAQNLRVTSSRIEELVDEAKEQRRRQNTGWA